MSPALMSKRKGENATISRCATGCRADPLNDLPSGEPASRQERWRAALYITTTAALITLVVLAVVFDQFAATGVLLVVFLSFILAYLIGPAVERLRHNAAPSRRGRPLSRGVAVLMIYGLDRRRDVSALDVRRRSFRRGDGADEDPGAAAHRALRRAAPRE